MTGNHDEFKKCIGICDGCSMLRGITMSHVFLDKPRIYVKCFAVRFGHVPIRPIFGGTHEDCRRLRHYHVKKHCDAQFYLENIQNAGALA